MIREPRHGQRRSLAFYNLHTEESVDAVYFAGNTYQLDALQEFNRVLRDQRTGDVYPIDPRLFNLLYRLNLRLGTRKPFHVISGYRSPLTNASLAARGEGVAKHSLHMVGQAIDIRVPGIALADVHDAALRLRGGGVGYYRDSDFVHMDVGRVRRW
jgi:uncharacterized protein YcbK (DUF882 family)